MASSYNRRSGSSASNSSRRSSVSGKRRSTQASSPRTSSSEERTRNLSGPKRVEYGASAGSAGNRRSSVAGNSSRRSSAAGDGSSSRKPARSTDGSASRSSYRDGSRSAARNSVRSSARGSEGSSSRKSRRSRATYASQADDASASAAPNVASSADLSAASPAPASASAPLDAVGESSASESARGKARIKRNAAKDGDGKKRQRKSVKGKQASRKHDAAPAGTSDLTVSEREQHRRNREVDDVAASGARRVGDIRASRAAERAARARKRYLSYVLKIAAVIVCVLVVFFGSISIYRSNLLAVESVTVSGAEHLTNQEVTQLAAVPDDSTLLRLDTAGICARLEEHPWVQSASISRQFPHSIKIQITERTPAAVVKISKKSIWVISTDGSWLSAATTDDWKTYHRIVDVDANLSSPVAGSECTDEGILNALKIYDGVSSDLASQIKSISAASAVKASLTLKGGVSVAFGEASDIDLKEGDIWALMEKYSGSVSYINVRVPDRPTYRTAKEQTSS